MEYNLIKANWYQKEIGNRKLNLKFYFGESSYQLIIFDLKKFKIYRIEEQSEKISWIFKELNPGLEAPLAKVLSILKNALSKPDSNDNFKIVDNGTLNLTIRMETKISQIRFCYKFVLTETDNEDIREYFVLPFLLNNAELQLREAELVKIIQKKDKELDDYKSQGARLSRNNLATEIFNPNNFDELLKKRIDLTEEISIENPDKFITSSLSETVHESCVHKYYGNLKRSNDLPLSDIAEQSQIIVTTAVDTQTDSVFNECSSILLENTFVVPEISTKVKVKTPKKKKLF